MQEQLKLVHKRIDVVDQPNTRICVTPLRYMVDEEESSYAEDRLFGRKTEEEKFQQIVYVNYSWMYLYIFLTSLFVCMIK